MFTWSQEEIRTSYWVFAMSSKKSTRRGRIPSPKKKTEQKMYKGNLQKKKKRVTLKDYINIKQCSNSLINKSLQSKLSKRELFACIWHGESTNSDTIKWWQNSRK